MSSYSSKNIGSNYPMVGTNRMQRSISVVIRNLISIVGVLFLGWSAEQMVLLYFADALAGFWAVLTAVVYLFLPSGAENWGDRVYNVLSAAFGALFLVAFIAIPLGLPILFMVQGDWQLIWSLFEKPSFINGLIGISITNLILSFRLYFQEVTSEEGFTFLSPIKRYFSFLFIRWFIVIVFIYGIGMLLGDAAKYGCVVIYAATTISSELFPKQFANLIPTKSYIKKK